MPPLSVKLLCSGSKIPGSLNEDKTVMRCSEKERLWHWHDDRHMLSIFLLQTCCTVRRWVGANVNGTVVPVLLELELDDRNNRVKKAHDRPSCFTTRPGSGNV
jgi:hypothetical protein